MKVAFFFGSLNRGGSETLVCDVLRHWRELPFETVCVYRNEGNMSDEFRATGARLVKVDRKGGWPGYVRAMCRLVRREGVDVLHAQTSLNAVVAVLCSWLTGVKAATTFHGFGFERAPKWKRQLVTKGNRRLMFVSEYMRGRYLKAGVGTGEGKSVVVYNGIDFSKFGEVRSPKPAGERVEMGMVGSFGQVRDQLFVCRFLKRLADGGKDFHFTFVGNARKGEERAMEECMAYCKEQGIEQYVTFAGVRHDVPELLRGMDLFVYASRCDTFGIAVAEAIATGMPVMVNDWDVMKEVTHGGEWAWLYKSGDVEGLYELYCDFETRRDEYGRKAVENAQKVREVYSIERHIDTLNSIYHQITD